MLKFRLRATTRKPDGQLNKPYIHETQFEAPDISSAIQHARKYQTPPSDGATISWPTQINQPESRYGGLGGDSAIWGTN
jgi:hypothetical protein